MDQENNRLVSRKWDSKTNKLISRSKRLPNAATKLTKEIQYWYVKEGTTKAIIVIGEILDLSINDSFNILKYIRGQDVEPCNPINFKEMLGI
jgi:hypothetical protein